MTTQNRIAAAIVLLAGLISTVYLTWLVIKLMGAW